MAIIKGDNGKFWGKVEEDTYFTYRKKEHFCFKYQTYGISCDVIQRLCEHKVKYVCIKTMGKIYKSTLDDWMTLGIIDTLRNQDGEQCFLPMKYMRMEIIKDKKMSLDNFTTGDKL